MICRKCGNEINENAVFCDKCGAFVMREEYSMLPNNGYRKRKEPKSKKWIGVLLAAVILGIIGTGVGYGMIVHDRNERIHAQIGNKAHNPWDYSLFYKFTNY